MSLDFDISLCVTYLLYDRNKVGKICDSDRQKENLALAKLKIRFTYKSMYKYCILTMKYEKK